MEREGHIAAPRSVKRPPPPAPACLDCARARKQGRDHGCLVHVAEDLFP